MLIQEFIIIISLSKEDTIVFRLDQNATVELVMLCFVASPLLNAEPLS